VKPGPAASRAKPDLGGGNAADLRRLNLERLLAVVMDHPATFTRAELIEATGLSAPTVGSLVGDLIRSGVVRDLGAGPSRGGRRPSFMEFNARHGCIGGIDLGPTRTRLAVADLRGEPLAHHVIATPSRMAPETLLKRLADALRSLMREAHLAPDRLIAVGAGAPGAVEFDKGVVTEAPNLRNWSRVPMRAILERALRVPTIVENDVNLAILGERWRGAAKGHHTCVYITVGTGIGAGIIVDDVLHRGHHFMAGEIAFMCMGAEYINSGVPRCLESLASLKALAERAPGAARRDPAHAVADLLEAAGNGDRAARKAVEEAGVLIGMAVANLAVVVDPSLIVLAGATVTQSELLVHEVRRVVGRVVPASPEIVVSALGKEAPLWGCLLVAADEARARLRLRLRQTALAAQGQEARGMR
jgi:predicted NBD/HSP70 family sugar kinase